MKKTLIKVFSLALAATLFLTATGCSSSGGKTTTTTTTSEIIETQNGTNSGGSTTVTTSDGKNSSTSSKLEEAKKELNGYTFTIASSWLVPEDKLNANSPLFDRLFWEQAHKVEKELGCTIKLVDVTTRSDFLKPYIMAGNKVADIVETMAYWMPQSVKAGYFKDWSEVEGIDISDKSRWNAEATELGKFNGKQYGLSFYKPQEVRFCVMFNKTLLAKSGVDVNGIYDLVRSKQWTWDKLREYAMAATKDTNNDGINDTWGIVGKYDYIANAILPSFGGSVVAKSNGKYVYNLNSANSLAALNFYNKLVNTDKCVWVADQLNTDKGYTNIKESTYYQRFNNGTSAFLFWESWVLNQYTKPNSDFEYGILPFPLGGSQKEYVSSSHNDRIFCITSTNKDLDKVAVVMNALTDRFGGYEGDEWYEDIEADYFKNDVKDNLEMYKLLLNSRSVDYGLSISAVEEAFYKVVRDSIYLKNTTPAAAADSIKNNYTDAINSVLN